MSEGTAATVSFPASQDVLTEILREGAQQMLAEAIQAEVAAWLDTHRDRTDEQGRHQVVRNGHLPERKLVTGLGEIAVRQPRVRQPRVRDRRAEGEREPFTSKLLPPYLRKTKSMEELIPLLYLKEISTGDFQEALSALLGPECPGLSATTITRLKSVWEGEYAKWSARSLQDREYVYVWADGIHTNIRLEEDRQCILVLMESAGEAVRVSVVWRSTASLYALRLCENLIRSACVLRRLSSCTSGAPTPKSTCASSPVAHSKR